MTSDASDEDKLRKTYSDLRARLIAERDREEARISESRSILRRIAKDSQRWSASSASSRVANETLPPLYRYARIANDIDAVTHQKRL